MDNVSLSLLGQYNTLNDTVSSRSTSTISLVFLLICSIIGFLIYATKSDTFKGPQGPIGEKGPQGPIGLAGKDSSIAGPPGKDGQVTFDFMKQNTLWCADSDFCTIPTTKSGINYGGAKIYNATNAKGDLSGINIESDDDVNFLVGNNKTMRLTKNKLFLGNRDILAELDDLKANIIRKDKKYGVKSSRGGYLSDQGPAGASWKARPTLPTDFEVMIFDELK